MIKHRNLEVKGFFLLSSWAACPHPSPPMTLTLLDMERAAFGIWKAIFSLSTPRLLKLPIQNPSLKLSADQ